MTNKQRPYSQYMPAPDGFPILNTLTRHFLVRLLSSISNRLWETDRSDEFIFDQNYLIQGSGAVCGWDWDKSKPAKLQPDQSVSALDYELLQMVKETSKKLEDKNFCKLHTVGGEIYVNINRACEILAQVHGDDNDND